MGRQSQNGTRQDTIRVRQQTLKSSISCTGTGLHSGAKVSMTLHPAEPDTGIVFRRTDIAGRGPDLAAQWNNVVDTQLCTTIGDGNGVRIGTIEHLMAALAGCQIDNAVIELGAAEVPIMDGSAAPFVFLIECAGVVHQDAPRRAIEILKTVAVGDHKKTAILTPSRSSSVSFEIDFSDSLIAHQEIFVSLDDGVFQSEISRARTFGFDHEVATLRSMGLARGGSLENAIVVSGDRILNDDGLRYDDEFVRHKVLDSIGDLYLAGSPIIGHYHGYRSGHGLTNELLRALFRTNSAWRETTFDEFAGDAPMADWEQTPVAATA